MRRSHLLLGGAAVLAGLGVFSRGSTGPAAEIPGTKVAEAAAFASLAETAKLAPEPSVPPPAPPKRLGEQLDLDHITRVGDHFEAPLADGRHAILTLDPDLQAVAEKLLVEARAPKGGIVAMSPDGRILALAGRRGNDDKGGAEGTNDFRLATDAWAPSASVFKLVTASALVQAGVDPDDKIAFHGGVRSVMESNLADDKRDNNSASLAFGVAHSNNAILGKLAYQHLEPAKLGQLARTFGLEATFDQVPGVAGKLALPDLHDLEFAKAAAGFQGVELSAVGGALLASTFADKGEQPTPTLIASIVDAKGVTTELPTPGAQRVLSTEVASKLAKMMVLACEAGSAAKSFRHSDNHVAGKTGTLTRKEPIYLEHSWFVGFAPVEKPSIIVSVVLGNPENWHLRGQEAAR
ncbi:MAG: penicillin-binding transpeptidase domain-containing protein, partial [Proteobacteria bacterium]|nr:penicillin-binding transpeptidase domain-containing protein [Pseudomonadota bacterium]